MVALLGGYLLTQQLNELRVELARVQREFNKMLELSRQDQTTLAKELQLARQEQASTAETQKSASNAQSDQWRRLIDFDRATANTLGVLRQDMDHALKHLVLLTESSDRLEQRIDQLNITSTVSFEYIWEKFSFLSHHFGTSWYLGGSSDMYPLNPVADHEGIHYPDPEVERNYKHEELFRTSPGMLESVSELFDGVEFLPTLKPTLRTLSIEFDEIHAKDVLRPSEWAWFKERYRFLKNALLYGNAARDELAGKLPQPYLWIHLPRTGGAPIVQAFSRQNSRQPSRSAYFVRIPNPSSTQINLERTKMVYGDLPYGFDRWWGYDHPNRPNATSYGTMLRSPLDRLWSLFQSKKVAGVGLTKRTSFLEWVKQGATRRNEMTALLSGAAPSAWYNDGFPEFPPFKEVDHAAVPDDDEIGFQITQVHYEQARINLIRMGVVGIFERFEESWSHYRIFWGSPKLPPSSLTGTHRVASSDLSVLKSSDIQMIHKQNYWDFLLYRLAVCLFKQQVKVLNEVADLLWMPKSPLSEQRVLVQLVAEGRLASENLD